MLAALPIKCRPSMVVMTLTAGVITLFIFHHLQYYLIFILMITS